MLLGCLLSLGTLTPVQSEAAAGSFPSVPSVGSSTGRLDCVEVLLEAFADVNAVNTARQCGSWTPLMTWFTCRKMRGCSMFPCSHTVFLSLRLQPISIPPVTLCSWSGIDYYRAAHRHTRLCGVFDRWRLQPQAGRSTAQPYIGVLQLCAFSFDSGARSRSKK